MTITAMDTNSNSSQTFPVDVSYLHKTDPCEVILGITLEETECHIVNPKPLDQCNTRMERETKVTAKCNVTVSSVEGKAAVKRYICDTEPASHEILVTKCPDCPSLLPLHDPKALESVKTATH
ncbi:antihemorrhagic factor cHLP-B-like [Sinocyclocheilus rhinocerous]|uniref:antihemorrhagic factor cHLP-B-like n=1 Tax=Sinocyclocheilus rhinocerous TaxID=307959 RepID=UPI0007B79DD3|nr:PREDICTED: antihemorrhagic factor cHLP-B-like [Sinocyclocheilus rhinocerous]